MPGILKPGTEAQARETFIRNLQWAADQAAPHDVTLLLEAINQRDKPGYFYSKQVDSKTIQDLQNRISEL
jgi:hydroxypyruvate isomerase